MIRCGEADRASEFVSRAIVLLFPLMLVLYSPVGLCEFQVDLTRRGGSRAREFNAAPKDKNCVGFRCGGRLGACRRAVGKVQRNTRPSRPLPAKKLPMMFRVSAPCSDPPSAPLCAFRVAFTPTAIRIDWPLWPQHQRICQVGEF